MQQNGKHLTKKAIEHVINALKSVLGDDAVTLKGGGPTANFELHEAWIGKREKHRLSICLQGGALRNLNDDVYRIWAISDKKLNHIFAKTLAGKNRVRDDILLVSTPASHKGKKFTLKSWKRRTAKTNTLFQYDSDDQDPSLAGERDYTIDLAKKIAKTPGLNAKKFLRAVEQSLNGKTLDYPEAPYTVEQIISYTEIRKQRKASKEQTPPPQP